MTTHYINVKCLTLVCVTYDPTKRQYDVMDYSRREDERMSVAEFCERVKKEYEPIRRAKIIKLSSREYATMVRSKSSRCVFFKTYSTYDGAFADAIRNCLPLVTYVRGANGTAIGLNTDRTILIVSKYYRRYYYLLRAFDREYNR